MTKLGFITGTSSETKNVPNIMNDVKNLAMKPSAKCVCAVTRTLVYTFILSNSKSNIAITSKSKRCGSDSENQRVSSAKCPNHGLKQRQRFSDGSSTQGESELNRNT
ncbi:hypothetical protein ABEB36_003749 [Hypothenemus hampei]|uniref:Uncharacterized protein n=1 Tax=Hypothenemus hampei TaxID=57062 RepID=A0ABD1F109_HYPHA